MRPIEPTATTWEAWVRIGSVWLPIATKQLRSDDPEPSEYQFGDEWSAWRAIEREKPYVRGDDYMVVRVSREPVFRTG